MVNETAQVRLKKLMDELNISQTDICKRTGIGKSAMSNYVNGTRVPRQDAISKISEAYSINPAWIMGYDVEMLSKDWKKNMTEENARLNIELLKDDVLLDHVKKLKSLSEEHKSTIYDNIDFLWEREQH